MRAAEAASTPGEMKNAVFLSVWGALVASGFSIPVRRAQDGVCASKENFLRIASEDSCTKYIQCYSGDSYLMQCPDHTWFNEAQQICDDGNPPEGCDLYPAPPPPDSEEEPGSGEQPDGPVEPEEPESENDSEEPEEDVDENSPGDGDNEDATTEDPNGEDPTTEEEGSGDPGAEEASGENEVVPPNEDDTNVTSEPSFEGSGDDYDIQNPNIEAQLFEESLGRTVFIQPIDVQLSNNRGLDKLKHKATNEDNWEEDELMDMSNDANNSFLDESVEEPTIEPDFAEAIPENNTQDIPMYK